VVSESVARRFWGAADPIGKRIRTPPAPDDTTDAGWRTVVGVVRDTRFRSLRETTPMVYVPWEQLDGWQGEFAVRATGDPAALAATLRRVVREVAPDLDAYHIETMAEALGEPLARPRMTTLLLSGFSVVALLLAAVGLYGALASVVGERTRELGVRMALGAAPSQLRRAVLGGTLAVVGAGGAAGVLGALAGSRLLASLLYEVSPTDPATLAGVCVLLVAVGLAAAYVPARRATRVSPVEALRAE
jgi:putative ABC transport system permease protein